MKNLVIFVAVFLSIIEMPVFGGRLSATAEIAIDGVEPGRLYSLRELSGSGIKITNGTELELTLLTGPVLPDKGTLRKGYIAIPALDWAETGVDDVRIPPGGSAEIDVLIYVPDEKANFNKKFQIHIYTRTVPKEAGIGISYGLESVILIKTKAKN